MIKRALIFIALIQLSVFPCLAQDTSCGIVWYPAIQLSDSTINAYSPKIALSGEDTIHIIWTGLGRGLRQPYARSTTGGSSFEPIREMLPDSVYLPYGSAWPTVVANAATVYIFFVSADSPSAMNESPIRMLKSTDRGATFQLVRQISPDTTGAIDWATVCGDSLALIYPPQPTLYRRILRSTDGGQTWTKTSQNLNTLEDLFNRISLTPGTVHMVEHIPGGAAADIGYRESHDLGTTWTPEVVVSTADGLDSFDPSIAAYQTHCGTVVLTAWRDSKYGCIGILGCSIMSRVRLGNVWLPEVLLTDRPLGSVQAVAINNHIRAVAFSYEVAPYDTFHLMVRGTNEAISSFCPMKDLTPGMRRGGIVNIAVSSHAIHLVWEELVGGNLGTFRIFYRRGEFIPSHASVSLSTESISFDSAEVYQTRTDSMVVTNTGSDQLIIGNALADDSNFSVAPPSATILPSQSATLRVNFSPLGVGEKTTRIVFFHNGQSSPDCFSVTGKGIFSNQAISYLPGKWNLVSLPLKGGPATSLPSLMSYQGGSYVRRDTMKYGLGYWAKPANEIKTYTGIKVSTDSMQIREGWNLVGSVATPTAFADVNSSPPGITTSLLYGFDGKGYFTADSILPGKGYWLKATQAGTIYLSSPGSTVTSRLRIVSRNDTPPLPPEGETSAPIGQVLTQFELDQNYPNPFNATTLISYELPVNSYVTLKVYDVLGREVASLVNGQTDAGTHFARWNAEKLPSGVYYYRLDSYSPTGGVRAEVRKMLLTK